MVRKYWKVNVADACFIATGEISSFEETGRRLQPIKLKCHIEPDYRNHFYRCMDLLKDNNHVKQFELAIHRDGTMRVVLKSTNKAPINYELLSDIELLVLDTELTEKATQT